MKVADENIVRFERSADGMADYRRAAGMNMGMVYASQRSLDTNSEHDGRGLLLAIVLCMACWAVLGFFLLT